MAYDETLAGRIRNVVSEVPEIIEKKMFGGIGFLVKGNMACGVHGSEFIVRIGAAKYGEAIQKPNTKPFDLTGKSMSGWLVVLPEGIEKDESFRFWIQQSIEFAHTLPEKVK